eukprot:CCRYP_008288-RA/>CCRYP_008288-RA protein AED:0.62 eAED:0.56 QI:0/0/0/1/0/0/2/0/124
MDMDCYPNKKCELHLGRKLPSILLNLGRSRIDNKTARHIRNKFTQCWLCRYPRPMRCVHDKGGKFIGSSFQSVPLAVAGGTDRELWCGDAAAEEMSPQSSREHLETNSVKIMLTFFHFNSLLSF